MNGQGLGWSITMQIISIKNNMKMEVKKNENLQTRRRVIETNTKTT